MFLCIFILGHTNIPSMHPIQQPSAQAMGVRGPPSMPNLPVQSTPQVVTQQPTGRADMMRYGNGPASMSMGHTMQNITSLGEPLQ